MSGKGPGRSAKSTHFDCWINPEKCVIHPKQRPSSLLIRIKITAAGRFTLRPSLGALFWKRIDISQHQTCFTYHSQKNLMKTEYVRMLRLQQVVNCGLSQISRVRGTRAGLSVGFEPRSFSGAAREWRGGNEGWCRAGLCHVNKEDIN